MLLFPCAIFGYGFIATFLQNGFPYSQYAIWVIQYVRSPLISFLGSFVFILIGFTIAPKFKLRTAMILLIIFVVTISMNLFNNYLPGYNFIIVKFITGLLGGILAYCLMAKIQKN